MKISQKIFVIILLNVLVISVVTTSLSIFSLKQNAKKNIEEFKKAMIEEKKATLKEKVDIVYKIINDNYKKTLPEYIDKYSRDTL